MMVKVITDVKTYSFKSAGLANRNACKRYLKDGVVPRVKRDDGDAGIASVYPDGPHELYHHGADTVDVRRIRGEREDGHVVGLIDLEHGEVLQEPTDEPTFDPDAALPSADELRGKMIAERVVELAREDRRDDTEIELREGVRVDPAPLTYRGASVEVDHDLPSEIELGIINAVGAADGLELFSRNDIWDKGFWAGAIEDESRLRHK